MQINQKFSSIHPVALFVVMQEAITRFYYGFIRLNHEYLADEVALLHSIFYEFNKAKSTPVGFISQLVR